MAIRRPQVGFTDKVAVVTGAGSGIGRALSLALARRGVHVVVTDVNEVASKATAELVRGLGAECVTATLDVADPNAFNDVVDLATTRFGVIHQLYNNAGIAHHNRVANSTFAEYERVMGINFGGVVHGTRAFLPSLIASGDGHVVNVSSLNGYFAQPGMSHYVSSKYAVRGFTESLRAEMLLDRLPVRVSLVHPGGIKTDIANAGLRAAMDEDRPNSGIDAARAAFYNDKLLKMPADRCADIIVRGVQAGRPRIRVGKDAVALDLVSRAVPALAPRLAAALERRLLG